MWRDDPAAELAAAAEDLRQGAELGEAAGLIPHWDAEARRTGADILDSWRLEAGRDGNR